MEFGWVSEFPVLQIIPTPMLNDEEDIAKWKTNEGKIVDFSVKREEGDEVQWCKTCLVFTRYPNLSHMFILWMAVQERLQTQDRVMVWNKDTNIKCALCKSCPNSHSHLFFQCQYSKKVWSKMKGKMSMRIASANWKDFVSQLASICTNNSVVSMLRKMVLQCLLYMAREEQKTFYTQEIRTEKAVTECISEAVKLRLMTLKVLKTTLIVNN
ncbi:reverse transcriptase zinc-binding domain-containing protein [Tanacetum coccineum]